MKLWEFKFKIDTGYEWLRRYCIIVADTEEDAKKIFHDDIESKQPGERFVMKDSIVVSEIATNSGVVYQGFW